MKVDIFIPCFIDQLFPDTGFNMVKVLEHVGCEVHYNKNQTCCGQPAYNSGYFEEAKEVGWKFLDDFSEIDSEYIVVPSASCVGMVKESYQKLFTLSSRLQQYREVEKKVIEFTDFLVNILKVEKIEGAKLAGKATYHDSCSALRECGLKEEPRKLLSNVEGLELVEMKENEECCGFGGSFAVKYEPISIGMGDKKLENALETEAKYLISTDSSCLMHLNGYAKKQQKNIECLHIADVLAAGI